MELTLSIVLAIGAIGAVDVLYFHLWRFRLYARADSVAEEVTHLVRQVVFVTVVLLLASDSRTPRLDIVILTLIVVDLVNSAIDTLIERRSRASLGGLPPLESLVHIVASFGMGVAAATYFLADPRAAAPVPAAVLQWQVRAVVGLGVVLLVVESSLLVRSVCRRRLAPSGGGLAQDRVATLG